MKINENLIKHSIALAVTGSLLVAGHAKADMVTLSQGPYSYSDGGEFTAVFTGSNPIPTVQTFCDEISTVFYSGTSYSYQIVATDSEGYTLTAGAAYLYSQFIAGTLTGYDYTADAAHLSDAGLLQAALWTLQGQTITGSGDTAGYTSPSTSPSSPAYNPFYALAYTALAYPTVANNGLYPVGIMQMYSGSDPAQAQFVPIPAPEVPMTHAMVFGGLAIAGYSLWRRKSAASVQA
jgi:hypothetical protein